MATSAREQQSTRERVLTVLRSSSRPMTTAEVARRIRVHPNTVRFHLDTLIERGQVEQVEAPPTGPGRPAVRVRAVPGMDPLGRRHYRLLAEALMLALAGQPDPAGRAEDAGHAWGRRIVGAERETTPSDDASADRVTPDSVAALTAVLDALGFAPEHRSAGELALHNCPFLELADVSREVVCSVHLGLMRGALKELGSDTEVTALVPFARPDLCVAQLAGSAA